MDQAGTQLQEFHILMAQKIIAHFFQVLILVGVLVHMDIFLKQQTAV
jgi:hypothetical protein